VDFNFDATTEKLRAQLLEFMDEHVYPAERRMDASQSADFSTPPLIEELKTAARERGLWNFFCELPNLSYAPLAEITGWSPKLAPEAVNCSAPDTGNMEVLAQFGTPEQKERWLKPLLSGEIRSAFCMTEPKSPPPTRRTSRPGSARTATTTSSTAASGTRRGR
jgi:acyl-CoA dehydrogenase